MADCGWCGGGDLFVCVPEGTVCVGVGVDSGANCLSRPHSTRGETGFQSQCEIAPAPLFNFETVRPLNVSRMLLRSEGDTELAVDRQRRGRPRGQEECADVGADEEDSEGNEPDDARLEIEISSWRWGGGWGRHTRSTNENCPNRAGAESSPGKISSCSRRRTRRAARSATA